MKGRGSFHLLNEKGKRDPGRPTIMLDQQTIEKLYAVRLRGMADAFVQQEEDPQVHWVSFAERLRCWWIGNGTGAGTGRSSGGSKRLACKVRLARKILICGPRGVRTNNWSGR